MVLFCRTQFFGAVPFALGFISSCSLNIRGLGVSQYVCSPSLTFIFGLQLCSLVGVRQRGGGELA